MCDKAMLTNIFHEIDFIIACCRFIHTVLHSQRSLLLLWFERNYDMDK